MTDKTVNECLHICKKSKGEELLVNFHKTEISDFIGKTKESVIKLIEQSRDLKYYSDGFVSYICGIYKGSPITILVND